MAKELFPVGIRTSFKKYFTVEAFGDQLNAAGTSLRTKQVFVLETDGSGHHAFRTHKGKYLSADHKEVTAGSAQKGANEWFTLRYPGEPGLVGLETREGKFIGVDAAGKVALHDSWDEGAQFEIEINMHPQVCLSTQKRYIGLDAQGHVVSNKDSQFGKETLLTLEPAEKRGQHAIKAYNGKYFSVDNSGTLVADKASQDESTAFTFEPFNENFAIKHVQSGKYLSALASGVKASRATVSPKEIFSLVDSDAQITLKAVNGKYVAIQGANLITNKTSVGHEEIFIMEFQGDKVSLKDEKENYWSSKPDGGLVLDSKSRGPNELFSPEYTIVDGGSRVSFRTAHGGYVYAKSLGGVDAKGKSNANDDKGTSAFEYFLFNRPQIVFKADQQSYVGTHAKGDVVVSNKPNPESFLLQFKNGTYSVQNAAGLYWKVNAEQKLVYADQPEFFVFEFRVHTKLSIRTLSGFYLTSENQGWIVAKLNHAGNTEEFEF